MWIYNFSFSSLQVKHLLNLFKVSKTVDLITSDQFLLNDPYKVRKAMLGTTEIQIAMNRYLETSRFQGSSIYQYIVVVRSQIDIYIKTIWTNIVGLMKMLLKFIGKRKKLELQQMHWMVNWKTKLL